MGNTILSIKSKHFRFNKIFGDFINGLFIQRLYEVLFNCQCVFDLTGGLREASWDNLNIHFITKSFHILPLHKIKQEQKSMIYEYECILHSIL